MPSPTLTEEDLQNLKIAKQCGVTGVMLPFVRGKADILALRHALEEAGLLFSDDYGHLAPDEMCRVLAANVHSANIPSMVITMGGQGAVYARANGECGVVPAKKVDVIDTTGAGDAFFAGTTIGLTYGKTLAESCEIGSRLAASVICITENVCPRFRPLEFGLNIPVVD